MTVARSWSAHQMRARSRAHIHTHICVCVQARHFVTHTAALRAPRFQASALARSGLRSAEVDASQ
eukprot:scaffold613_cov430-Prasinococcus_capsulatus_cf.AAC.1